MEGVITSEAAPGPFDGFEFGHGDLVVFRVTRHGPRFVVLGRRLADTGAGPAARTYVVRGAGFDKAGSEAAGPLMEVMESEIEAAPSHTGRPAPTPPG